MNYNEYSFYNNTPTLKVYRQELLHDDGFISVYLDISSKMAYCNGYLSFKDYDNITVFTHLAIGTWKGFDKNVCEYFPEYADFILSKHTNKPFTKWSKKSKILKILCDFGFISISTAIQKRKRKDDIEYYIIKVNDYVDIFKDSSWKHKVNQKAVTSNGFFFVNRDTIIKLSNYCSVFLAHRSLMTETKKQRKNDLNELELPKKVKKAILDVDKNDKTKYAFSHFDAFYDMMFNTTFNDPNMQGSKIGAVVSINSQPITTYEALADRWNWSKAKVSRFFKNHSSICTTYHLNNNKGTVVYLNHFISTQSRNKNNEFLDDILPSCDTVLNLFASDAEQIKKGVLKTFTNAFRSCAKKILQKVGLLSDSVYTLQNIISGDSSKTNDFVLSDLTDDEFESFVQQNMPSAPSFDPYQANAYVFDKSYQPDLLSVAFDPLTLCFCT